MHTSAIAKACPATLIVVACDFCSEGIGIIHAQPEHISSNPRHFKDMGTYEIKAAGRLFNVMIRPEHENKLAAVSRWIHANYKNLEEDGYEHKPTD